MATTARKTSKRASNKQFDNDQLTTFYKDMLLIRRFEEKAGQLYGMGLIGGFVTCISGRRLSSSASSTSWRRARTA